MKYLILQTPKPTVLDTYLTRNVRAVVQRYKTTQKVYVPEAKAKDYFGTLKRFKSFCVNTLPYLRTEKMKHKIYRASVEIVIEGGEKAYV